MYGKSTDDAFCTVLIHSRIRAWQYLLPWSNEPSSSLAGSSMEKKRFWVITPLLFFGGGGCNCNITVLYTAENWYTLTIPILTQWQKRAHSQRASLVYGPGGLHTQKWHFAREKPTYLAEMCSVLARNKSNNWLMAYLCTVFSGIGRTKSFFSIYQCQ